MSAKGSKIGVSIHCVDEFLESETLLQKTFWLSLLIGAGTALGFALGETIREYFRNPYMITTTTLLPPAYPPITICPGHTADEDKLARHNLSFEDYAYLTGYFIRSYDSNLVQPGLIPNIDVKTRMDQFVSDRSGSIQLSLLHLSVDPQNVVHANGEVRPIEVTVYPIVNMYGPCAAVDAYVELNALSTMLSALKIEIQVRKDPPRPKQAFERVDNFFIGERSRTGYPSPVYQFPLAGFRANIHIKAMHMNRCADCGRYDHVDHYNRLVECIDRECAKLGKCSINYGYNFTNITEDNCSVYKTESHFCRAMFDTEVMKRCSSQNPSPCQEWIYSLVIFPLKTEVTNATMLVVSYENALSSYSVEQRYVYNWYGILSMIGGQLSLWYGASLLSIPQLVVKLWQFLRFKWSDKTVHNKETVWIN